MLVKRENCWEIYLYTYAYLIVIILCVSKRETGRGKPTNVAQTPEHEVKVTLYAIHVQMYQCLLLATFVFFIVNVYSHVF